MRSTDRDPEPPTAEPGPSTRRAHEDPTCSSRARRLRTLVALGLTLLALAPVVAVLLARTGRAWLPPGDMALIELRVRDVWSLEHFPLVGPYSRFGWNHPGPSLFWALAIPSGLTRGAAWATQVGGALLQGVAVAWMALLAWRRAGLALLALVLVGVSLVYATTGSWMVLEPWNPHIAVPFFALLVLQAWLLMTGDRRMLPAAAVVATFLVQMHVGYAPLVLTIAIVVAAYALVDHRTGVGRASSWRRPALVALALVSVLWAPAVIQTALEPPGNLVETGRYFVGDAREEQALGAGVGVELMASEFRWPPTWIDNPAFDAADRASRISSALFVLVPLGLLALAWESGRRRADVGLCRAAVLAAALLASGVVALSRITGAPWGFLYYWRPVIGVFVMLVVGAAFVRAAKIPYGRRVRQLGVVAAIALVAWGAGDLALAVVRDAGATGRGQVITSELVEELEAHGVPEEGVLLRRESVALIAIHHTLYPQLERAGHPVFVDDELGHRFGARRTAGTDDVAAVWSVAENGPDLARLTMLPEGELIALSSPLPSHEAHEALRIQRELTVTLTAAGRTDLLDLLDSPAVATALAEVDGVDSDDVERLAELNLRVEHAGGHRAGVVAFPPDAAPQFQPD